MTAWGKVTAYQDYFGGSMLDAYFAMVDSGEIRESDHLRGRAEKADEKFSADVANDVGYALTTRRHR